MKVVYTEDALRYLEHVAGPRLSSIGELRRLTVGISGADSARYAQLNPSASR